MIPFITCVFCFLLGMHIGYLIGKNKVTQKNITAGSVCGGDLYIDGKKSMEDESDE